MRHALAMLLAISLLAAATPLLAGEYRLADVASAPPDRFDSVVIDAGHGGEDQGARGARGTWEKDAVLAVALELGARLQARGLRVVATREDDRYVSLEQRNAIANDSRGDLFLSIHANAAGEPSVQGTETYFLALDAGSGDVLWKMPLGSPVTGYPVSYAVDGRQYVAVGVGGGSAGARHLAQLYPEISVQHGNSMLYVFALPD